MFHQWTKEFKNWYLTKGHQTSFYYLLGGIQEEGQDYVNVAFLA